MTLEKKLARLRKREGLSQAEVSEKLDVSRQAVTKWETGTSRPSIENLQSLSRLYNVPLEYLLDESRDELPAPAPAAPAAEKGPEQTVQKKEKQWIRPLMIGAVVLALLVCFLFWYGREEGRRKMSWIYIRFREKSIHHLKFQSLIWIGNKRKGVRPMGMKRYLCLLFACIAIFGCIPAQAAAADIGEQAAEIAEPRATGKFDFEIPAKTLMESSTSFPMEYGETVTITASYSPASASVDFGLIDSDGVFYPVRGSNGSINQTIRIDLRGTYTFAVRNNSSYKVSVSGFVNY